MDVAAQAAAFEREAERAEEYLQQREAKEAAAERSRRTAERRAQADEQKQKETPPPFVI